MTTVRRGSSAASVAQDPGRRVGRTVVDDDDLEVRVGLGEVGADRGLDPPLLVAGRDDDRDERRPRRGRPRLRETPHGRGVDGEEDEADRAQRGRSDQDVVEESYDSGTFWRASARYGEVG